jgi:ERCC4-related helicase
MHYFAGFEPAENIDEDIRKLEQEAGLDEVKAEHATELLDSHGQQQSNEYLEELAKELSQQTGRRRIKIKSLP